MNNMWQWWLGRVLSYFLLANAASIDLLASATPVFGSWVGGSATERVNAATVDAQGYIYLAGDTYSADLPGGSPARGLDLFVMKLSPSGTTVQYVVVLGGGAADSAHAIAVNAAGEAYITGSTTSPDFPYTSDIHRTAWHDDGLEDAFVIKLDVSGAVRYAKHLGGRSNDRGHAIAVDAAGAAYVAGATNSSDFPVTLQALQKRWGNDVDCFVAKLDPAGVTFLYATYLGGEAIDDCFSIVVDGAGSAIVAGSTRSQRFPVQAALRAALSGTSDAFVSRLAPDGASLSFSTYLGGDSLDEATVVAVDSSAAIWVAGTTTSVTLGATGPMPGSLRGGYDGFLFRLTSTGSAILYSRYLGGSGTDQINSLAVAADGRIVVGGHTSSIDFPTVSTPRTKFGGMFDGFVSVFSPDGRELQYSAYLGNAGDDRVRSVVPMGSNGFAIAGHALSQSIPALTNRFALGHSGQYDAFFMLYTTVIPTLVSVTPTAGSGSAQLFTTVYASAAGGLDIMATQVKISDNGANDRSCYFGYVRQANQFLLLKDDGTAWMPGGVSPGSGSLSNSRCTLSGAGSSATVSGNQLSVVYNVQFHATFAGTKTIWTNAYSEASGQGSLWQSSVGGTPLSWIATE